MTERHKIILKLEIPKMSEKCSGKQCPEEFYNKIGMVCTGIWASLVAQLVKNPPAMQKTPV